MKTKIQKQEELKRGRKLLEKNGVLMFADFTKVSAEDLHRLRTELKKIDADFLVIKKRLLNLLFKEKGIDLDAKQFKLSAGTIFFEGDVERASGPVYKFFSALEIPEGAQKDLWIRHILGGYDVKNKSRIDAAEILLLGQLPPRGVLLAQLLGMIAAPIKSLLYILSERSKKLSG